MKKYKMHHGDFTVEYGGMVGLCIMPDRFFPPGDESFTVWIHEKLKGKEKLDTLIHELLHAEHPDMSEEDVLRTATNLANVLHGEGYRQK